MSILLMLLLNTAHAQSNAAIPVIQFNHNLLTPVLLGIAVSLAATLLFMRVGMASGATALKSMLGDFTSGSDKTDDNLKKQRLHEWAENAGSKLKLASNLMGAGTTLMVILSLFLGGYLAAAAVNPASWSMLVALALFVWAGYTLTVNYIQARVIADTVTPVTNAAYGAGQKSSNTIGNLLASSERKKMRKLVRNLTRDIKKELDGTYANSKMAAQLDKLIKRSNSKDADSRLLLTNLAEILNHTEIKLIPTEGSERVVVNTDFSEVKFQGPSVKKAIGLSKKAYETSKGDSSIEDKVMGLAAVVTPGSKESTQKILDKISQTLRSTGNDELNPDQLKEDFKEVLNDPNSLREVMESKMDNISRDDLISTISSETGVSEDKLRGNMDKILGFFSSQNSNKSQLPVGESNSSRYLPQSAYKKLSGLENTPFAATEIEKAIEEIVDEPTNVYSILKSKFSDMSREDFRQVLEKKSNFDKDQIDTYMERFDKFKSTSQRLKLTAQKNLKDAQLAVKTLSSDVATAGVTTLWWRAAAPLAGAAASVGGASLAVM